jgi:N-acetylglucosaminyl-diphospho-decaprenol L-rhamnosyltransferase
MGRLAIIVVAYNSASSIDDLLDGLPAALGDVPAVTVVVDNGSTDDTLVRLRARDDVVVVANTNTGYAGGINRGAAEVPDATAYLILNPDLTVSPGCIPPLLEALAVPGVGIAAPRVEDENGHLTMSLRRVPTLGRAAGLGWTGVPALSEYVTDPADYDSPHDADWALGAALAVSRTCADAVGPWDESFFLYSEETDYCLRAAEAGFVTRYVPQSTVVHTGGGSGRNDATHVMQIVNRVRLYARRNPGWRARAYWGLNVLSEITWILRGHPQSRASVLALLQPRRRPVQLGCSDRVIPI